jgi:hypothetical protein
MPLVQTRGAASAQGFGEFAQASAVPNYIEEVFSCFLYTGTGASQTITNGIDLSTKGGLTWIKGRSGATGHRLTDTARGATKSLASETTAAEVTETTGLTAFGTTGFTIGADADYNTSAATYVSWTFRKQPKFFDVVTYTGNGTSQNINHNLGSVPACIIVKRTNSTSEWSVYHRSLTTPESNTLYLNYNYAAGGTARWNNTAPTSSVFSVGTSAAVNASGGTYVAYIFAHNAGGFGLTGTDNVISCGSYTGTGNTNNPQTLGYEPQWLLIKNATMTEDWYMFDTMRGFPAASTSGDSYTDGPNTDTLLANTSDAEVNNFHFASPTATGFTVGSGGTPGQSQTNSSGATYIYIAIRRGPMKVPTDATKVFSPAIGANVATSGQAAFTAGFPVDLLIKDQRSSGLNRFVDRLRGGSISASGAIAPWLRSTSTAAEAASDGSGFDSNTTVPFYDVGDFTGYIGWMMRRAPSFFDEVCYTGTGSAQTLTHNLGVVPELMIVKDRTTTYPWDVYHKDVGSAFILQLNTTGAKISTGAVWNSTTPTASVFSIGTNVAVNTSGNRYVWYGFSTCVGVSKVGSYTGNGTTQTIDCGFGAGGARFVLIKRTDSTGDWYVYDTARGMTTLTDPYLLLNSAVAESATLGSVTTVSTGFALDSTILAAINVNGGTYIFLAIA